MTECVNPGLYVHIPFCKSKCLYCDFFSVTSLSLIPDWMESIRREILLYRDCFSRFDSIYLGGGTPSLLSDRELAELAHHLRSHLSISHDPEFTVEANPDDITPDKLVAFRDLGVNRVSLGVQSFDEQELRFLKRRHTAEQALKALDRIKNSGFSRVGLDLMYGLPGQTESAWVRTLEQATCFNPEHISCYQLTVEERTPLGKLMAAGRMKSLDEETERAFFILTSAFLEEKGYLHYEISNFAKRKENICRHNMKYWQHVPYLGLGPSAHSFQNGVRWWNERSIQRYCEILGRGERPLSGEETLSESQVQLESLMLGFRMREGIKLDLIPHESRSGMVLRDLKESGLIEVKGQRIMPTRKGFLVADGLPLLFSH